MRNPWQDLIIWLKSNDFGERFLVLDEVFVNWSGNFLDRYSFGQVEVRHFSVIKKMKRICLNRLLSILICILWHVLLLLKCEKVTYLDVTFIIVIYSTVTLLNMSKCDMSKCDMCKCDMSKCDMSKCDMSKCDMSKCHA